MTTALYRRYRPETFADVIGQEHVTDPLMAAVGAQRASHAYLFSGPRGCGKTTSARILARCLNCANGPTPVPCGTCDSCVELARGGSGSLDVVEIDAASHNGVDDARELRERAAFAPARDRYKIFILDEAHMVTPQGFNALLKLVEEPPPHVKFIFATTEPDKVISTIRSRTHHYPFRLVPPDRLQAYLERICTAEGVAVGSGVLPLVVRAGGGSVRDSLSVLDQLLAGADGELDYAQAVALLGYTPETLLDDVVEAFEAVDGASVFRVVDRVIESGHDPRRFVEDLLQRLRDLIVIVAAGERAADVLRGVPEDQFARMTTQAQRLGLAQLSRAGDLTMDALTEMTGATSPRLQLELLCARLLLPAADEPVRGYGARIERLEKQVESGVPGRAGGIPAALGGLAASSSPEAAAQARKTRLPERAGPVEAPARAVEPAAQAAPADRADRADQADQGAQGAQVAQVVAPGVQAARAAQAAVAAPVVSEAATPSAAPEGPVLPRSESTRPQSKPTARAGAAPAPAAPATAAPATAVPSPAAAAPPGQAEPEQAKASEPPAGLDAETVRRRWPEVLETLSRIRRASWTITSQNAQVVSVTGKALHLRFDTPGIASTFRNGRHAEVVEQALRETLGLALKIEAVADENPGGDSASGTRRNQPGAPAAPAGEAPDHAARAAADWATEAPRPSAPRESGGRQGGSARAREHADPDQEGSQGRPSRQRRSSGAAPERAAPSPAAGPASDEPPLAEPPGEYDAGPEFAGAGDGDPYAGAEYPGAPAAGEGAAAPEQVGREPRSGSGVVAETEGAAAAAVATHAVAAAAPVSAAVGWPGGNSQVKQSTGGNAARGGSAEKPDGPRRDWLAEATAASSSGRLAGPSESSPTPAGPDEWSPSDLDEPDVSDPDLDVSPLMGAQLVQRVFGATVIDEIAVDPVGSPARSGP